MKGNFKMKRETPIHEAIKRLDVDSVELIDILMGGEKVKNPICLLRSKYLPGFAFLMWILGESDDIHNQMVFKLISGEKFSGHDVVCACCFHYVLMLHNEKKDEIWRLEAQEKVRDAIVATCQDQEIHTIFVGRPADWRKMSGDVKGLRVFDAQDYRKIILSAFDFMALTNSQGEYI